MIMGIVGEIELQLVFYMQLLLESTSDEDLCWVCWRITKQTADVWLLRP